MNMRRQKSRENTHKIRRGIALWLALAMLINMFVAIPESKASSDTENKKQVFEEDGYKLELSVSSSWDDGYVAEVIVTNTGKEEIRNWSVVATMENGDIERSWNVTNKKVGVQEVVFESESHNMILGAEESASFGFRVTNGTYHDIMSLKLVQGKVLNTKNASLTLKETSSWDGHKIYEGTITNNSGVTMRDWSLSFETEGKLANIWNATVISEENGTFYIKNCDYNAVIEDGASVTFGFEISFDTDSFDGIHNARIYASENGESNVEEPTETKTPVIPATPIPTATPKVTEEPIVTEAPTSTPAVNETPGTEEEITEDDIQFVQVENRDWNMDMIRANDGEVEQAKKPADRKIRVTMLDSGINYSEEVDVVERKNFVEGEDEMSYLFEDGSGHGTAIAEVLASNPDAALEEEEDDVEFIEEYGEYTYYGDVEDEDEALEDEDEEDSADEEEDGTVSFADLLDSGYEWTEGVNPNIELYSGKILDADNETTVERAVAGIEWAIENDTDILSLSIGMDKDSDKLHDAIKKAEASGMLIIAAVGDDEKVDYPAAYPEVMSVGMVNSMGETVGIPAEVVAPGEGIVSRGAFDSMQIFSGSSMAVPHVVGLASILWQKDASKDAAFIRGLMDVSANPMEGDESCEYGLIDCKYALESYEAFAETVQENRAVLEDVSKDKNAEEVKEEVQSEIDNESEVVTEDEMEKLHGNWHWTQHQAFVSAKYEDEWTNGKKYVEVLKSGIAFIDNQEDNPECYGMREHPWFHGFFGGVEDNENEGQKTPKSNYMTSFRMLVELADWMRRKGEVKEIIAESKYPAVKNALAGIDKVFEDENKIGSQTWEEINSYCGKNGGVVPKDCRSLLIYGMALHTLGDTFSHSSFGMKKKTEKDAKTGKKKQRFVWKRYKHGNNKSGEWYADNIESRKLRYNAAKNVTRKALKQIVVDSEGLAGYENVGTAVNAFYAKKQFKKLKNYSVSFSKKLGKEKKLIKMKYFEEGYVLKSFSKYYEQEVEITGRTSKNIEKYREYVDQADTNERFKQCSPVQLSGKGMITGLHKNAILTLKSDGEALATLTLADSKLAFSVSQEAEYEVLGTDSRGVHKICTIRNGIMYDSIGRKMREVEPAEAAESDSESEEESEDQSICDMVNYEPSTDCLVLGKVVLFDYRESSGSKEEMPGLNGVEISAVSRDTGKIYRAETKQDGSYQLQVPEGEYDVTYRKDENYTEVAQFLDAKGDGYNNVTVMMIDKEWFGRGCLEGYLMDYSTRVPIAGATIKIYKGIGYYGEELMETIKTEENGYFMTTLLQAGAYTFVVSKDGYETKYYYESIIGNVISTAPMLELRKE